MRTKSGLAGSALGWAEQKPHLAKTPASGPKDVRSGIDVVIVTYNASQVIESCLRSLADTPELNIIVVDNSSSDNTVQLMAPFDVQIIECAENLGFGAACNMGAASGSNGQVLFLNPDTVADAQVVLSAAEYALQEGVGILGCRLVTLDGKLDHAARRNVVRPWVAAKYLLRRSRDSEYLAPRTSEFEAADVDAVNGAFMLIERAIFESVAGFDETFWMYMEDVDLCVRVKAEGRPVRYWPGVTVTHIKSGITGRSRTARLNYHFYKSLLIFYRKHQAADDNVPMRLLTAGGVWGFCGYAIVRDTVRRALGLGMPHSNSAERRS